MDAASLTQALYNAFCTNKPLDMKACSGVLNDYESAYAVQRKFAELKGEPTGGYKISLTSKTTQDMFGTTEPLFGEQTKSHIFAAPCTLELEHMNEPLIEVELSMIPKVDLTSSMSDEELLENITVAGCIIHGTPVDGKTLTVAGLNAIRCELFKDGKLIKAGNSTEVLDNPIHALKWLVAALEKRGRQLKAGQVVSSGTFFVPPHLERGEYIARYTGTITEDVKLTVK